MNAQKRNFLTVLVLLPTMLGLLTVFAAAVFDPDAQPTGYVGQPEVSSNIVTSGSPRLYAIDYSSQNWSGNLHSFPLTNNGAITTTDDWVGGAAAKINAQHFDTGRKIVTWNGGAGVQFRWAVTGPITSSLSSAQKTALDSATAATTETSSPVLDYIRGGPSGLLYRTRSSVLGDIIHSTPVHCRAVDCTNDTVFVGANDGMLHAINATDGTERFAYIPSVLIPKLSALTNPSYTHKYYVDGRMDLKKIAGQTILAGALGAGGKGLFGLDVTDAAAALESDAAAKILWEITNTGINSKDATTHSPTSTAYANLGYTYGAPTLLTLPNGVATLIVGNGYNNTGNGCASLLLINPKTGALIREIDTGSGSIASPNGLSSPSFADTNSDGKMDTAYAGDIDGNLWKFDLVSYAYTKLHTTDPVQAITMAPGIKPHPKGGHMVTFVTGRMLTAADETDPATHYAYGIWDGAPAANTALLSQTLTEAIYPGVTPSIRVRTASSTVTNAVPDWTAGAGHHKGWKTALPLAGERVVGDGAYVAGSVFLFMSTNPTVSPTLTPPGDNWWMQLNALTGGDNGSIKFDLNADGSFTSGDQLAGPGPLNPVGRNMGGGVRSQLIALSAQGMDVYQASYDKNGDPPTFTTTEERGVSGGHFDFDIYNYDSTTGTAVNTPTGNKETKTNICVEEKDVPKEYNKLAPSYCTVARGFSPGFEFMTYYKEGDSCSNSRKKHTITCSQYTGAFTASGNYRYKKHVHEYDDIYDVSGVNMLNASDPSFNLSPNVILSPTDTTTELKVLVMNQYLNPAAKISVGGAAEESVKTYNSLASQTDAATLLSALPTYTRNTIGSLTFNLPLDAFKSKDWWGDGGAARAGLMPTDYSCVIRVNTNGSMVNTGKNTNNHKGLKGQYDERFNGALTIQIIRASTPATALEPNGTGGAKYGWRVKQANFTSYVLAEYTAYWHHPNNKCYGETLWVPNPPEDHVADAIPQDPAIGSADPKDGIFSLVGTGTASTVTSTSTNADGTITVTTVVTHADGSHTTTTAITDAGGAVGVVTGGAVGASGEVNPTGENGNQLPFGRINWRELQQ